ncbi:aryl hydrocarbon receptor nuclear translocator-like 1a-like [Scleropages formosus]|uniref:Aryl hydrocarbon receptor nuclear translocator-like 1a-like n=1 Tax=Scleropages formosus TaxID=113540 RepID=A0A0P7UY54_SCLFO|nr:aryl hydrocarbon receptor nuclear translocator-like 1a-like [Scleropages formosus]
MRNLKYVNLSFSFLVKFALQNDLIGQSLFDYLHPKDIAKVKEQLSSSDTAPRERLIDAKSEVVLLLDSRVGVSPSRRESCCESWEVELIEAGLQVFQDPSSRSSPTLKMLVHYCTEPQRRAGLPVKTDIAPGPSRLCSGARRSFFCRMKCNRPSVKMEDKEFPSTCSKKKGNNHCRFSYRPSNYVRKDVNKILIRTMSGFALTSDVLLMLTVNLHVRCCHYIVLCHAETVTDERLCCLFFLPLGGTAADRKSFCTIHSTGYLKSWPPTKVGLDEDSEPDNEGCNLSCLVAIGRLHPHIVPQPSSGDIRVKPTEYVSRHAIDGKFVFVDQRATAILTYLPQELLGTSFYEYFHQDDIGHLAECHRQVLQMREKIHTNCYKFKIKDGSFITLRSRWFSFMNPWTKEVEYIVSTNTVVSGSTVECVDPSYPQLTTSPHSMDSVLMAAEGAGKRALQTVPGIAGGTRAGAGKIGRMIAEEVMEIQRIRGSSPSSCGSSPLNITTTPPPDTSSPGGKKIQNGEAAELTSAGLLHGQDAIGYPYSNNSIMSDSSHLGISIMDEPGSSSPSNDEAAMAVIMSLLEADAGLGGPVDFSDLPWPL